MSFNILKFGIQNLRKDKKIITQEEVEEKIFNSQTFFPDCSSLKHKINILKNKIKRLNKEEMGEKLKLKKFEILTEKLKIAKEAINEKLNLNSPQIEEIDPLCSFEEIQKYNIN